MAKIEYVVPVAMDSVSVRIRTLPYAVGNGQYYFQRKDVPGANLSDRLQDSLWIRYLQSYGGGGMSKVSVGELANSPSVNPSVKLSVIPQTIQNQQNVSEGPRR